MPPKLDNYFRVVSLNLNGLRSASTKGVIAWMHDSNADVICMQETRIQEHQWLEEHKPVGWHTHLYPANRAGYAGTAIYSKDGMHNVRNGLGFDLCDSEGRFCSADFKRLDGSIFTVASVYFPSGSSGDEAQARKEIFLEKIFPILKQWIAENRSVIICGDVNIAHKQIDIKNWKGNIKNSGFLPHERAWIDNVLSLGYIDAFRHLNHNADEYSWWSNRGQARANNVGWRIDYQFASPDWLPFIKNTFIYRDTKFSDHAAVVVDYHL